MYQVTVSHCRCLQYLVQEASQRVFLVAEGEMRLLEDGVAEYVQQLSSGKKRAPTKGAAAAAKPAGAASKGGAAAAGKAAAPVIPKGVVAAAKAAAKAGRR